MNNPNLFTYLLRLADDNMIVSQRLSELISTMPELELDIAVANIALDHLGQARNLYTYAAEVEGKANNEDNLAMERDERGYLNAVLVEQPNGDFAHTMARQLFVDAYQVPLYEAMTLSADETLRGIAAKSAKEARYHLKHSAGWVIRMGDGTEESHHRMQTAIDDLWMFTADLFSVDQVEDALIEASIAPDIAPIRESFDTCVADVMDKAKLMAPSDPYQRLGGRTGFHTEHLGHILPELQALHRSHPGASW